MGHHAYPQNPPTPRWQADIRVPIAFATAGYLQIVTHPNRHSRTPSRHSRTPSRHSHTITSFPHTITSFPHTITSFPHTITSFPRRRESSGLCPTRIHRNTSAAIEERESTFLNLDLGAPEILIWREPGTGIGPAGRDERHARLRMVNSMRVRGADSFLPVRRSAVLQPVRLILPPLRPLAREHIAMPDRRNHPLARSNGRRTG